MCGIIGFIGRSLHPNLSYCLASNLFKASECRGTDAAGFWAASEEDIYFHKESIQSSRMILNWKGLNPFLFLGHARAATQGDPKENKNNQPFVSQDKKICLVHNGRVFEYDDLKINYQLQSECDSEILLRIFESRHQITDLLTLTPGGPTAGAIASIIDKSLWLFRNEGRPLWLIDLRELLGQIFFCSTFDIWLKSRWNGLLEKVYPILENEVWYFNLEKNIVAKRFNINYN